MRLYSLTGATALTDPATGETYRPHVEHGGFDFPDEFSDQIQRFATRGKPQWENDIQRQQRLLAAEMERRKDPAAMLGVMEQLLQAAKANTSLAPSPTVEVPTETPEATPKQPRARKTAATKPKATE